MKASYIAVCAMVLVLLLAEAKVSVAACSPIELSPCISAITSSQGPSKLCCTKLRQQQPCLCQYIRNPNLKKLVTSPNARKVANICKVHIPKG